MGYVCAHSLTSDREIGRRREGGKEMEGERERGGERDISKLSC